MQYFSNQFLVNSDVILVLLLQPQRANALQRGFETCNYEARSQYPPR